MPIDRNSFPLRELRRSRELAWDPGELDFSKDKADWDALDALEKDFTLRVVLGFLLGERGVTHDLAPLQQALRRERGRMEEEMYLTAQLFEESTHVEFFQRWMDEVLPGVPGRDLAFPAVKGDVFSVRLPRVMQALHDDRSPRAQLRASTMYHMIVEGVLGESGYQIFYGAYEPRGLFPGLIRGVRFVQRDEVRHIAFGTYFLQRLIRENPDLAGAFESDMREFKEIGDDFPITVFGGYAKDAIPFGLDPERFSKLATQLWETRLNHVKRGKLVEAAAD